MKKIFFTSGKKKATAPQFTATPTLSAVAFVVGNTVTCNATYTGVVSSVVYTFYRGATVLQSGAANTYDLLQTDAGNTQDFYCKVGLVWSGGVVESSTASEQIIFDANAYNYVNGTTLTDSQKNAYNKAFLALKSNNIWSNSDRIYAQETVLETLALKCLKTGVSATKINNPTFVNKQGFLHNGTSSINLNYKPASDAVNFTVGKHTVYTKCQRAGTGVEMFSGLYNGVGTNSHYSHLKANSKLDVSDYGNAAVDVINVSAATRIISIVRTDNAGGFVYVDGVIANFSAVLAGAAQNIDWFFGGRNVSGVVNFPLTNGGYTNQFAIGNELINNAALNTILTTLKNEL